MQIKHKGHSVYVAHRDCAQKTCFWPRIDPGVFTQGRGYRKREGPDEWICGTNAIHGCPIDPIDEE